MRAIVLDQYGGPEVLRLKQIADLDPGSEDTLVRVAATALNRADTLQRQGLYPQPGARPEHEIPGLEFAGTVERIGARVTGVQPGQRVMGLLPGGGYAEQVVTHARMLLPVPDGMTLSEAASIPEVFFTAYDALFPQAGCALGDTMLVHAGGSGIGIAAIQLAKAAGARVLCTVGNDEKAAQARMLGSDIAINYKTMDFKDAALAATDGAGVDIILDVIGGPYLDQNLAAAALGGRIVFIGLMGGPVAPINLGLLLGKRLRLFGTTLRSRPIEAKIALTQAFMAHALPLFRSGALRPIVDREFPLAEAAAAHRYMEENRNFGKIVLRMDG